MCFGLSLQHGSRTRQNVAVHLNAITLTDDSQHTRLWVWVWHCVAVHLSLFSSWQRFVIVHLIRTQQLPLCVSTNGLSVNSVGPTSRSINSGRCGIAESITGEGNVAYPCDSYVACVCFSSWWHWLLNAVVLTWNDISLIQVCETELQGYVVHYRF